MIRELKIVKEKTDTMLYAVEKDNNFPITNDRSEILAMEYSTILIKNLIIKNIG